MQQSASTASGVEKSSGGGAQSEGQAPQGASKRALAFILLVVFIDLLGVGLIVPAVPQMVERFNGTAMAIGWLTTCFSLAQFVAAPVLGALSDRLGRRPVLLVSLLGTSAGYLVYGWAGALWMMFLGRIIDGFTGGNISTAQAYIADVTPAKDRAKAYGLIGAAFGFGFMLGPALGGLLGKHDPALPAFAAAGLAFANAVFGYFVLPESLPREKRVHGGLRLGELNPAGALLNAVRFEGVAALMVVLLFLNFAQAILRSNFGKAMHDRFALDTDQIGWMFAFIGLMAILIQGGLVRKLLPRFGERRLALFGLTLSALGNAALGVVPGVGWVYASLFVMAFGGGLAGPSLQGLLSRSVDAQSQGVVMGAAQAVGSLAMIAGPLVAGVLYDHQGRAWPYLVAAATIALAVTIIAAGRMGRTPPTHAHPPTNPV
jgi:MFS family permease